MNILDLKRKLLPMSGFYSGGGSSPTSTTTGGLPEWAMSYAQDTLAKQAALSEVPYQAYGGNRIQGFTPMQETARQNAAGMQTSGITGQVAQRGLNTQNFGSDQASQYMNPYMQNVVDIQKREAQRQSGMQGVQQAGQATSSGALGGSRDAIMRAERERNLGQQMNDIQSVGSNAAYTNAQNQFNADQNRAMQGLGVAAGAGQQQFQQGLDINRLQSAYGAQQQGMGQRGLDMAYQDFLNQKAYPQTQLSNMANMMRGLPIQQQTTTGTPGSPSGLQQLGSLAQIGYGLSGFFADGGEVSSYADGGSVDSQGNIESIVHKLSDQQLAQAEQSAKARGDIVQMQVINMEKAARASMKRGIAAAPVDMDQMLPSEESMARGGIVAFSGKYDSLVGGGYGEGDEDDGVDSAVQSYFTDNQPQGAGDQDSYKSAVAKQLEYANQIANAKYEPMKPEAYDAAIENRRAMLLKGLPDIFGEQKENITKMEAQGAENLKRGRGLAFIQSGAAMLEGNDPWRAIGKSAATFSESYGGAVKADQAQKQALQNMKFNIADAQRKEQMGLTKDAIAAADQARKDHQAAQQFGIDKAKALSSVYKGIATTTRPGPAAKPPAPLKLNEQLGEAEIAAAMNPTDKAAQTRVAALRKAVSQAKSSFSVADIGGVRQEIEKDKLKRDREAAEAAAAAGESKTNAGITAEVEKRALLDPEYQQALSKGDTSGMKAAKDRMYTEIQNRQKPAAKPAKTPTAADDFDAKWAKLKSGQSLVGPDGKTYTKQ
jgi:hypothetical protein